jgi:hypothetical protein
MHQHGVERRIRLTDRDPQQLRQGIRRLQPGGCLVAEELPLAEEDQAQATGREQQPEPGRPPDDRGW